jgi:hypothetical protein
MAIRRLLTSTITNGIKYNRSSDTVPAIGGTVTFKNGYIIHTFTSDGTFTPYRNLNCEYLIVAGGGGAASGGAGAGGMKTGSFSVTSGAKL